MKRFSISKSNDWAWIALVVVWGTLQGGPAVRADDPVKDIATGIDRAARFLKDGQNPDGWSEAEIVLVGVSRVGKTPLSMYLTVLGWRVANVPLVPNLDPSPELFRLDPRRVIGLTMEPGQLVFHRQQRRRRLGATGLEAYTDPVAIYEELEAARKIFRRHGFSVIDVTDKPIEASANQVIDLITRRFGEKRRA